MIEKSRWKYEIGFLYSILLKGSKSQLEFITKIKLMKDTVIVMKSITIIKMILKKVEFYQECLQMETWLK